MKPKSVQVVQHRTEDGKYIVEILDPPEEEPTFLGDAWVGQVVKSNKGTEYIVMEHQDDDTTLLLAKNPINSVQYYGLDYRHVEGLRHYALSLLSNIDFQDELVDKITIINSLDYKDFNSVYDRLFIPTYDMYRDWVRNDEIDLSCNFSWWLSNPALSNTYHLGVNGNGELGVYGANESLGLRYCCWAKDTMVVLTEIE